MWLCFALRGFDFGRTHFGLGTVDEKVSKWESASIANEQHANVPGDSVEGAG